MLFTNLSAAALKSGCDVQALVAAQLALEGSADNVKALYRQGEALLNLGMTDDAIQCLKQAAVQLPGIYAWIECETLVHMGPRPPEMAHLSLRVNNRDSIRNSRIRIDTELIAAFRSGSGITRILLLN